MNNFQIIKNLSEDQYNLLEGVRSTTITTIHRKTLAHAYYQMHNPEQKPHFKIGNAFHDYILRPDVFKKKWGKLPIDYKGTTKEGKEIKASLQLTFSENILTYDEFFNIRMMFESYMRNPDIRYILENMSDTELTIQYTDPDTNILCKCRLDLVSKLKNGRPIIGDLKSTLDASNAGFAKTIVNYSYHISSVHYLVGAKLAGIVDDNHFIHLLAEKTPPYLCSWQVIDDGSLDRGGLERFMALRKYEQALLTGNWTGYPEKLQDVALPHWEMNKELEEIET